MSTLIKTFQNRYLAADLDAAIERGDDVIGWRLDDGAEVLRIGWRLAIAEPDGAVLVKDPIPGEKTIAAIVRDMRACCATKVSS